MLMKEVNQYDIIPIENIFGLCVCVEIEGKY